MEEVFNGNQSLGVFQTGDLAGETVHQDLSAERSTTTDEAIPVSAISQKLPGHGELGLGNGAMQLLGHDSGYNSSESSIQQSSPSGTLSGEFEEKELVQRRSRASSRTSISSIPASVLTNLPDGMKSMSGFEEHGYAFQAWDHHDCRQSRMDGHNRQVHMIRQREATFRKPSSVRAMQMHTEDEEDDEYLTPPKRRGQRISDISLRSPGSSPLKRSPFYSPTGVSKPKVKKEYPLVLLHCTLLPPSLPVPDLAGYRDSKFLQEVLPPVYWKRWKLLEEKVGSGVLRDRGVLISHPEDMYDLLEERLLESLELQRPRLDHGHFLARDEADSDEEEQATGEDTGSEDEGDQCPDCGGHFTRPSATRKWEIKVFAANGLMRAGAWAAAWKEMEKVDVEVGLWLPSDVRAELEKRLAQQPAPQFENNLRAIPLPQEPVDDTACSPLSPHTPTSRRGEKEEVVLRAPPRPPSMPTAQESQGSDPCSPGSSEEIDLKTLLVNYIRVLASDRRNVAIVLLSALVVFSAINSRSGSPNPDLRPFPQDILEYTSVTALQQRHISEAQVNATSQAASSLTAFDATPILASTPMLETLLVSEAHIDAISLETSSLATSDTTSILASPPMLETPLASKHKRSSSTPASSASSSVPSSEEFVPFVSETSIAETIYPVYESQDQPMELSDVEIPEEDVMIASEDTTEEIEKHEDSPTDNEIYEI